MSYPTSLCGAPRRGRIPARLGATLLALLLAAGLPACDALDPEELLGADNKNRPGVGPATTLKPVTITPDEELINAIGHTRKLRATVLNPAGKPRQNAAVTWRSLNPEVATVDSKGKVTAAGAGLARITATSGGRTDTASVHVRQVVASVELEPERWNGPVGSSFELTAVATDSNGVAIPEVAFVWSSSHPAIAEVDESGWITAKKEGSADITVMANPGSVKAKGQVQVGGSTPPPPPPPPSGEEPHRLTIVPGQGAVLPVGTTFQFAVLPRGKNGDLMEFAEHVTWRIRTRDTHVAQVSKTGLVTALSEGTARLYVELTLSDGTKLERFAGITVPPAYSSMSGKGWLSVWPDHAEPTRIVTVPSSIDGTGKMDVSAALQAWIDATPDGSVLQLTPGATYRAEHTLRLVNRRNLVIDGRGATLLQTIDAPYEPFASTANRQRRTLAVEYGENIVFRRLVIRGSNAEGGRNPDGGRLVELEGQHAFHIHGTKHLIIEDNIATHVWGDLVYLRGGAQFVKIRRNHLGWNGRQGISLTKASDVLIGGSEADGNTIEEIRRSAIDLEPNGYQGVIERVVISHNRIGDHKGLALAAHGWAAPMEYVEFNHNRFFNAGNLKVSVRTPEYHIGYYRNHFRVIGNWGERRVSHFPIRMTNMTDIWVEDNYTPMREDYRYFFEGRGICRATVRNNQFPGGGGEQLNTKLEGCSQ